MATTTTTARRAPARAAAGAAGALAGVLLLVGCASPGGSGDADASAAPLRLMGTGSAAGADIKAVQSGAATWPGLGGWVLDGTLPSEPTRAAVLRWTDEPAAGAALASLAAALGLPDSTDARPHGVVVTGPAGRLAVRAGDGRPWAFVRTDRLTCPPFSVDVDTDDVAGGTVCAIAEDVAGARGGDAAPSTADARAVAAPVLAAAGISAADAAAATVSADGSGPGAVAVTVSPTVAGLPTRGIETVVVVDADGVVAATGRLDTASPGAQYPLRTAAAAFDELVAAPVPAIGMPCDAAPEPATSEPATSGPATSSASPAAGGAPAPGGCASPQPTRVTGARLGLMLVAEQRDDAGTGWLLAPAWFLAVAGGDEVPVLALAPSVLAPATPVPVDPGTGGAVEPGSPGPVSSPGAGEEPGSSGGGSSGSGGSGVDPGLSPEPVPSGPSGPAAGAAEGAATAAPAPDATTPPQPKP